MRRRTLPAIAVFLVALLLAGCGGSGSGGGPSASDEHPVKGVESGTLPAPSSAPDESLINSAAPSEGSSASSSSSAPTDPNDFTNVHYVTPPGFVKDPSGVYAPAVPLETTYNAYYLSPTNALLTNNLLSIFVYTLPTSKTVHSSTNTKARVLAYNKQLKAKIHGPIKKTTLAGKAAWEESISQPPNFHYVAWFAFGTHHLLELACQAADTSKIKEISAGCTVVQLSMTISS